MAKKNDELVEEMSAAIRHYAYVYVRMEATRNAQMKASFGLAESFITRIGKAYADGELRLPGEKERITFGGVNFLNLARGDIVIALRPLSGTGKEDSSEPDPRLKSWIQEVAEPEEE